MFSLARRHLNTQDVYERELGEVLYGVCTLVSVIWPSLGVLTTMVFP